MKRITGEHKDYGQRGFVGRDAAFKWLKRELGIAPKKFEELKRQLIDNQAVSGAVAGDFTRGQFLSDARTYANSKTVQRADGRKGRPKSPRDDDYREMDPDERHRAAAFSEYLALQADKDFDVREFRKRLNQGVLLSEAEARGLVLSQAARVLTLEDFKKLRVPLLKHKSSISVTPVSASFSLSDTPPHLIDGHVVVTLKVDRRTVAHEAHMSQRHRPPGPLWLGTPRSFPRFMWGGWLSVWPGSVLDEVRILSHRLADRFPWNEQDATLYALAGTPPPITPLAVVREEPRQGRRIVSSTEIDFAPTYLHDEVTVRFAPWIRPESLKRVFMQRHRRGFQIGELRDSKSPGNQTIALFHFIVKEMRKAGGRPKWADLFKSWNSTHEATLRYSSMQTLRQAFLRGQTAIAFQGYIPESKKAKS